MASRDATFEVVRTSLEMFARPKRAPARPPSLRRPVMLLRAEQPTLSFYRYLYNTIGRPSYWYVRRLMDDDELNTIILDESVAVYVLYVSGVPAGMAEIDMRDERNIELAYIGLVPEFLGRGLGRYLVEWAIDTAWDHEPDRVWINTCNLDHPAALPLYQKAGFTVFNQEKFNIPDPKQMDCFNE